MKSRKTGECIELTLTAQEAAIVNALLGACDGDVPRFDDWSDFDDLMIDVVGAEAMKQLHGAVHARLVDKTPLIFDSALEAAGIL